MRGVGQVELTGNWGGGKCLRYLRVKTFLVTHIGRIENDEQRLKQKIMEVTLNIKGKRSGSSSAYFLPPDKNTNSH